jgi:hypothetical protein
MPQAPELAPTVAPTTQGIGEVNLPVPVDAFGGAVGHALQGLGSDVEKGSDRIWQRAVEIQNLNNETEAKEADAQYMMKAGLLHAQFGALEGNAAAAAFPKHMQDLQDLRTGIRGGLSNPMAQRMYDASSLSVMGRTIFNAAGHAAQQGKVAASNASQARVDQMSDSIGTNPTDELTYQRYTRGIRAETQSQGEQHGWSPEQTEETSKQNISTAIAKRVVGLAKTDAIGAQAMFDRASKSGDLLPTMADKVQATVQTQFRQQGSRVVSDRVLAGRRAGDDDDKGEAEYLADGEKAADEIAKQTGIKDPLFKDFVRDRIMTDYNRQKRVERDGQQESEQTIIDTMNMGNKEGILPASVDELKAIDPRAGDAWDSLTPKKQAKYMQLFAQNAIGEPKAWTPQAVKQFQMLKGLAHTNPVEFLSHDISADGLPSRGQQQLSQMQKALRKDLQTDPRVGRALSILQGPMNAAGLDRKNKEDYDQFVGSLADQLDEFQHDKKRTPTIEEVQTMGKQLMDEHVSGMWQNMFGGYKTYQTPVPEEDAERIKNDPRWGQIGVKPTDYWVSRQYHREVFNKLYGGKSGSSETK